MSPEQAAGNLARVDRASDIYSLGATLYCLLVGQGPFPSGSVADVLERVRRGIFPAPRRLRRSIDPTLEAICLKAMALEQQERHATALYARRRDRGMARGCSVSRRARASQDDVKRSLVRFCIERTHNLFGRDMAGEGMFWLSQPWQSSRGFGGYRTRCSHKPLWLECCGQAGRANARAWSQCDRRDVQPRRTQAGNRE